jgi:hypothetical protein
MHFSALRRSCKMCADLLHRIWAEEIWSIIWTAWDRFKEKWQYYILHCILWGYHHAIHREGHTKSAHTFTQLTAYNWAFKRETFPTMSAVPNSLNGSPWPIRQTFYVY